MTAGAVAVELGSTRFRAVAAAVTRQGIQVVRTLAIEVPETLDRSDVAAEGAWMGAHNGGAGSRSRRIFEAGGSCALRGRSSCATAHRRQHCKTRVDIVRPAAPAPARTCDSVSRCRTNDLWYTSSRHSETGQIIRSAQGSTVTSCLSSDLENVRRIQYIGC